LQQFLTVIFCDIYKNTCNITIYFYQFIVVNLLMKVKTLYSVFMLLRFTVIPL